ncbi:MAG: hypothetical protein NXI30_18885 [bacterium]|nr:hypothetical protein [bacterium]
MASEMTNGRGGAPATAQDGVRNDAANDTPSSPTNNLPEEIEKDHLRVELTDLLQAQVDDEAPDPALVLVVKYREAPAGSKRTLGCRRFTTADDAVDWVRERHAAADSSNPPSFYAVANGTGSEPRVWNADKSKRVVSKGSVGNPPVQDPRHGEILRLTWILIDIDPLGNEAMSPALRKLARQAIRDLHLPLWHVLDSGRGVQAMLRLTEPAPNTVSNFQMYTRVGKAIQARLKSLLEGAPVEVDSVHNANRQSRLAGTMNWKTKRWATFLERPCKTAGLLTELAEKFSIQSSEHGSKTVGTRETGKILFDERIQELQLAGDWEPNDWQLELIERVRDSGPPDLDRLTENGRNWVELHEWTQEKGAIDRSREAEWVAQQLLEMCEPIEGIMAALEDSPHCNEQSDPERARWRCLGAAVRACRWGIGDEEPGGEEPAGTPERNPAVDSAPGSIQLNDYATHLVVEALEKVLAARGNIYRRGAELARVRELEEAEAESDRSGAQRIYRHAGVSEIAVANPDYLMIELSRTGTKFWMATKEGPKKVPAARTRPYCGTLAALADETRFPILRGVSTTPSLDRDEPGYDPETGLFLAYPADMYPSVGMEPGKDAAAAALERLAHPLREFPFVTEADRSVALAATLLAVVRGELGPCPLHGFSAPSPGSGKTLLTSMVGVIGAGVEPSAITFTPDADEMEKRLSSLLRTGDQVILIDNVTHAMHGAFLCMMFTMDQVQARILGKSERMLLPSRVTVLATGNNLRFQGDMVRRQVTCTIDPRIENPENRSFSFNPLIEVKERRAEAVADVLTVLRAYRAAGGPASVRPLGSFEDYDLIRGALVWLDRTDPVETMPNAKADDPELEERGLLFRVLLAFAEGRVGGAPDRRFLLRDLDDSARAAIDNWFGKGGISLRRLGNILKHHRDRPFGGVVLRSETNRSKETRWWFEVDDIARRARWWRGEVPNF